MDRQVHSKVAGNGFRGYGVFIVLCAVWSFWSPAPGQAQTLTEPPANCLPSDENNNGVDDCDVKEDLRAEVRRAILLVKSLQPKGKQKGGRDTQGATRLELKEVNRGIANALKSTSDNLTSRPGAVRRVGSQVSKTVRSTVRASNEEVLEKKKTALRALRRLLGSLS